MLLDPACALSFLQKRKAGFKMENSVFQLHKPMSLLVVAIILVILFVTILSALKKIEIFRSGTRIILSFCVALLSVIRLLRFFVIKNVSCKTAVNNHKFDISFDFILLPYAVLALSVLLILFFQFISKIFKNHKENKSLKEIKRNMR